MGCFPRLCSLPSSTALPWSLPHGGEGGNPQTHRRLPPLPAVEPKSQLKPCLTVAGAGSQAPGSRELSPGP